jgi:hypothetical protein
LVSAQPLPCPALVVGSTNDPYCTPEAAVGFAARWEARWHLAGACGHINSARKVGRIPDGGGWRAHGRGSEQAKAADRRRKNTERGGYVCLHTAIDGWSRLACTEALPDAKAATAIAFLQRARAWFAAHGINHIERMVTDNGACYRAGALARALLGARHQGITPYTPRHNGKVERYNPILAEEVLHARTWHPDPIAPTPYAAVHPLHLPPPPTPVPVTSRPRLDCSPASPTSWPPATGFCLFGQRRVRMRMLARRSAAWQAIASRRSSAR